MTTLLQAILGAAFSATLVLMLALLVLPVLALIVVTVAFWLTEGSASGKNTI